MGSEKVLLLTLFTVLFFVLSGCVIPPVCGNGICELGENSANCPQDCGPVETHSECQGGQCITVSGPGNNECKVDSDCAPVEFDEIKIGKNKLVYTDAGGELREIPFTIRVPGIPSAAATEQVIHLDYADFFVKCYKDTPFTVDIYSGNYLNGVQLYLDSPMGRTRLWTDAGPVDIQDANDSNPIVIYLDLAQYPVVAALDSGGNKGARFMVDGNCTFTETNGGLDYLTPTYSNTLNTIGPEGLLVQTYFFDDDDYTRGPLSANVNFTKPGVLTDSYVYQLYYSSAEDAIYLLHNHTGLLTENSNRVYLDGTDTGETGDIVGSSYYRPDAYWFPPGDASDLEYFIAQFVVERNFYPEAIVMVDTAVDDTLVTPNSELSYYNGCVYYNDKANYVKCDGTDNSAVTADGVRIDVADGVATIRIPVE